jgi:hypothetical protein
MSYAGFSELDRPNASSEVACCLMCGGSSSVNGSPLAAAALQRIGALYEVEKRTRAAPPLEIAALTPSFQTPVLILLTDAMN